MENVITWSKILWAKYGSLLVSKNKDKRSSLIWKGIREGAEVLLSFANTADPSEKVSVSNIYSHIQEQESVNRADAR